MHNSKSNEAYVLSVEPTSNPKKLLLTIVTSPEECDRFYTDLVTLLKGESSPSLEGDQGEMILISG